MRRLNARTPAEITMDSITKLQFHPATGKPTPFSRSSSPKKYCNSNRVILIITVFTLSILLCLFFVNRDYVSLSIPRKKYGIVIDGGSTGTRIHVFEYGISGDGRMLDFDFGKNGLASMRVNPGLSSYADDIDGAGKSLKELLEFGKGKVPKEYWGSTEIRLMATAGMRLLDLKVQEMILKSCRRVLRSSGFKFQDNWASVITGSDEGLYAWVVANHALGTLGGHPQNTTGIIELGGASAQVTFVANEPIPPQFSHTVRFGNYTYHLYSHSLLHFGQNVAMDSMRESLIAKAISLETDTLQKSIALADPCTPKGYPLDMNSWSPSPFSLAEIKKYQTTFYATGNYSECRSASLKLFQEGKEKCSYKHCFIGSTFIPKLHGKFFATENFFYTSKFFDLGEKASLSDMAVAGEQFCGEDWSKLRSKYPSVDKEVMLHYCFSSAYIVALLHDSLGIALNDQSIGFANQVGDTPLDWALGAFILQTTTDMDVKHSDWIGSFISEDSPTLLSWTGIIILLLFTAWFVSKWRKPQLKTIYDLEKGRYLVTRVSRY